MRNISYTTLLRLLWCLGGLAGVAFRDLKSYASKYCVLLNFNPLLMRRMIIKPRN